MAKVPVAEGISVPVPEAEGAAVGIGEGIGISVGRAAAGGGLALLLIFRWVVDLVIGGVDLIHSPGRLGVVGVEVGMILLGQTAVCLFDLVRGGVGGDA